MPLAVRARKRPIHRLTPTQLAWAERAGQIVGGRLRALRKAQGVRLMELAKASGVDIGMISRMEHGLRTGTPTSHLRLVTALGYKLTELYAGIDAARSQDAAIFQPPSQRAKADVQQAGTSSMAMLTSNVLDKKLMSMLIVVEPNGSTPSEEARVGTEKFLYLLEGEVEATVGEQRFLLKPKSSLYLDASVPHQLTNATPRPARCLCVVTPPTL